METREEFEARLRSDGYTEKQSKRMGRMLFPTPREAALLKAQAARRKNAAERREASTAAYLAEYGVTA